MNETPRTILVTGVNGFVGHYLAEELHRQQYRIVGVAHHPEVSPKLTDTVDSYMSCDLTDQTSVNRLDLSEADAIIHLAGLPSPALSFKEPQKTINDNSGMLITLFERALQQKAHPRFVVVSSGTVYDSNQPMPLHEESRTTSTSPYAVSKMLCELLCDYYRKRGFECIVARPFNHTGPGQGPGFLIPDLTANVLAAGEGGVVQTGTLTTERDYSDVRDIVRAYVGLATTNTLEHQVFNLSSGKSHTGQQVLEMICKAAYDNPAAVRPQTDPTKVRPYEAPSITTDNSRIRQAIGWEPQIPLQQTIQDYVEWYRHENSH